MTPRKEKALSALLTNRTRAEAARAAGIAESTLRGYLRDDPEFQARYKEAFGELVQDATRQAQQAISADFHFRAPLSLQDVLDDVEDQGELPDVAPLQQAVDFRREFFDGHTSTPISCRRAAAFSSGRSMIPVIAALVTPCASAVSRAFLMRRAMSKRFTLPTMLPE